MKSLFAQCAALWCRQLSGLALIGFIGLVTGCTTLHPSQVSANDPLQSWNRSVYSFNEGADRYVLKPTATVYRDYVPQVARTGIGNFFSNLGDLWRSVNHLLTAEGKKSGTSFVRFVCNSTLGLGGILDVATELGLEKTPTDFGLTLGRWGVPAGPYLVLPFLGPSNVRGTAGLPLDFQGNLLPQLGLSDPQYWAAFAVDKVNLRANLLGATDFLDDSGVDKYAFIRDAYLQQQADALNPDEEFE